MLILFVLSFLLFNLASFKFWCSSVCYSSTCFIVDRIVPFVLVVFFVILLLWMLLLLLFLSLCLLLISSFPLFLLSSLSSSSFGCSSSCYSSPCVYRLLGLVVRRPPRERKIPGLNPACAGIFSGSSHTSDLNIGTPVVILPGAWRYRVSAGTGRPGVSIL